MEKYYGNYLGIVVNTNDPENRNRIQVWVPNLTNTLYNNWNTDFKNKIIDYNGYKVQNNDYIRLINALPWAECASPLIGGGTVMNINPYSRGVDNTVSPSVSPPIDIPNENPEIDTGNNDGSTFTTDINGKPIVQLLDGTYVYPDEVDSNRVPVTVPRDKLPVVEPELPVEGNNNSFSDGNSLIDDASAVTQVPTGHKANGDSVAIQSNNNITSQQFKQLSNFVKSTDRGSCVWDGTSGQCSKGVTAWAYGLTKDPKFLRGIGVTGGINARDIADMSFSGNNYFQDSGLYGKKDILDTTTYKPQIGDVVAHSKNHIIIYLGTDENGKEIWQSDINDKSPIEYMRTGQWPSNPTLMRLNDVGLAKLEDTGYVNGEYVKIATQQSNQSTTESNIVLSNPTDNYTAANGNPSPAGAAKGVISSPSIGARVWMFFYGGDIQKPVYFAMSISAPEYRQAYGA